MPPVSRGLRALTEPPGWGISVSRSGEFQMSVINGPAGRVLVEVDVNKQVRYAQFQYHGWYQPWFDAPDQWNAPLTEWAAAMSELECSYCRR
jgi:hypothetical protein